MLWFLLITFVIIPVVLNMLFRGEPFEEFGETMNKMDFSKESQHTEALKLSTEWGVKPQFKHSAYIVAWMFNWMLVILGTVLTGWWIALLLKGIWYVIKLPFKYIGSIILLEKKDEV